MTTGFFITGTDTDVGKTWISLAVVELLKHQGMRVGVMKPISAGCTSTKAGQRNEDALLLQFHSNVKLRYNTINPYAYAPAIAPHIAASEIGEQIQLEPLLESFHSIAAESDAVIVEGAGGWYVPINDQQTLAELAVALKLPVILVVGIRLGCLNHALLTAAAIERDGATLAGWIANRVSDDSPRQDENIQSLEQRINAPLLGVIPHMQQRDVSLIADHITLPAPT